MSRSDPDLHNAISLRPSPFHAHPDRHTSHGSESPSRHTFHHSHHHHLHHHASESPARFAHHLTESPSRFSSADDKPSPPAVSTAVDPSEPSDDPTARTGYQRSSDELARGRTTVSDLERIGSLPAYEAARDPYRLRAGLKDITQEKARVKANSKQKRSSPVSLGADKLRARRVIRFYEGQNGTIERLLTPVDAHVAQAREAQGQDARQFKIIVNGSFAANVALAVLQVYGAVSSGSLSLFTTMADAIFDPCSNLTLILCNRAVNRVDPRRFPSGKGRLETAGNIAFCFLMTAVSFILIVESAQQLSSKGPHDEHFHLPSVIAVAIAFVTKLCLFLYCWALRNKYSQIHILWEDHRNDLFINGFGLMTSVLGSKLAWWVDPLGAILLSLLIAFLWLRTAYQEFQLLIGVTAPTPFLQHATYLAMTHDPRVLCLDTVRAWHSGPRLIVEVDIVMDEHMTLRETHDVAEALQMKLESLPDVERAYVHVDYETDHVPEHFLKKEL